MPKGSPKASTLATERYQKKVGYMTKGFKIKRDIADEFARVCDAKGVSQAAAITELMRNYIDTHYDSLQGK